LSPHFSYFYVAQTSQYVFPKHPNPVTQRPGRSASWPQPRLCAAFCLAKPLMTKHSTASCV